MVTVAKWRSRVNAVWPTPLCVVTLADVGPTSYTVAERLFYSAIVDLSTPPPTVTTHTYESLIQALAKSFTVSITDKRSWVQRTYDDVKAFARCHWSPLAKPLPFASTYKQREILGCTRRQPVCAWSRSVSPTGSISSKLCRYAVLNLYVDLDR